MNKEQFARFTLLTQKVINTNASLNELKEYKGLLSTLNERINLSPSETINSLKNNHHAIITSQ